jgi:hypothetical protein
MPSFDWQPGALALVVRAMAEHQLGLHGPAAETLRQARSQIPSELRELGAGRAGGLLPLAEESVSHDWLIPEILCREAEALMQPRAQQQD